MSVFRAWTVIILICMLSITEEKSYREGPCDNIDIEMITVQTDRCAENTLRLGSVPVLVTQMCKDFSTFRNEKVPHNTNFDAENNFFDAQQTLGTNIMWSVDPEPANISLRYIFNFFHNNFTFFLYINGALVSMYVDSTVSYCDSKTIQKGTLVNNLGDYVRGRGIGTLRMKTNELQTKWKGICESLERPVDLLIDTNITECVSEIGTVSPGYTESSSVWADDEFIFDDTCTCGLLPVVGITAIIAVTVIAVTVLIVIRKRLGSIENRYHRELSRYWL